MLKETTTQASSIEEAILAGCAKIGIDRDDAGIEIIEYPKSKTLGLFGGTPAKVRVYYDDGIEEPVQKEGFVKEKKETPKNVSVQEKRNEDKPQPKKESKPSEDSEKSSSVNNEGTVIEDESTLDPNAPPLSSAIYLRSILAGMGVEATVTIRVEDERTGNLDVTGSQMGALIGRNGELSAALQYLVSLASNSKKSENYYRISVNIGKYRQRRDGIIEELAAKTAERSLRIGKNIAFEPMNPYERRVVHTTIQEIEGASSWSLGEGRDRHVVVGPAGVREGEEGLPPRREYNNNNRNNRYDNRGGGGYRNNNYNRGDYNRNGFRRENSRYENSRYGSRDDRFGGGNRGGYDRGRGGYGNREFDRHSDIRTMPNDYNRGNSGNNQVENRPKSEPKKDVQAPLYGRIQVPKKDN